MRTIQVVNVRWYNATAWYGVTLAHCLQKAGHESIVAGLEGTPPLEKAKEMGLHTVALPFNTSSPAKLMTLWKGMDRLVQLSPRRSLHPLGAHAEKAWFRPCADAR